MEKDFTWGGEPTIQYTDDVLYNCTPETYIVLLTNVTLINSKEGRKEGRKEGKSSYHTWIT